MTLLQLKYVVEVAAAGTISGAAKKLYIAQPSLTAAIKELEHEIGFSLFTRTNKGVVISPDGEEFLGYARQVIEQANLIEERYFGAVPQKRQFCVSTQHYSFAVEAFVDLIREYGGEEYDFRIRETQTYELIEDVAKLRSEVGVLYLNRFNETVIRKTLREHDLKFTRLFMAKPHVFIPVFPGTNCEYDSAKAFERAGADTIIKVFKNLYFIWLCYCKTCKVHVTDTVNYVCKMFIIYLCVEIDHI